MWFTRGGDSVPRRAVFSSLEKRKHNKYRQNQNTGILSQFALFLLRSHYVAQSGPVLKKSSCLRHLAARAVEDWEPKGNHQFVREDPEYQLELAFLPSCSPKLCSFSLSSCISLTAERDFGCTLYYPQECQLFIL